MTEQNISLLKRNQTTLVTFLFLLLALVGVSIWMIGDYLLAVTIGGVIAMVSDPVFRKLLARGIWPKSAALVVTIGILLLVIVPLGLCINLAIRQAITMGQYINDSESFSLPLGIEKMRLWAPIVALDMQPDEFTAKAYAWVQTSVKQVTGTVLGSATQLPGVLLQVILASIACFFFLLDGKRFLAWMRSEIPFDNDVRKQIVDAFSNMAIASIWATLAAGLAQSAVIFIAFLILGVPGVFLAAGITFIASWIPLIGSFPVWLVGSIYLYCQHSLIKMVAMIAFGLFTGIIDNIVRALILKGRSDMHPLVSLIAIFGGIGFFGISGVFFGPILAAVTISLLVAWPKVAQRFGISG